MRGTVTRSGTRGRAPHNPRRFPGFLRAHVLLILIPLVAASGALLLRSDDRRRASAWTPGRRKTSLGALTNGAPGPPRPSQAFRKRESIDRRLADAGYDLPPHSLVYGARVEMGPDGLTYRHFEAGGGALGNDFWPASSIKVLAALGALDFARSLGYTGDAMVVLGVEEEARTLKSIYEEAVRDSSNEAYDLLVQVAGRDRLNNRFLTPANGFPVTSISRSYAGADLEESPAMILEQGDRRTYVPKRTATLDPECDAGNCSNLFEMTESVRRVVLNDEIPPGERFDIDRGDLAALTQALLDAKGFFLDAVNETLGPDVRVYAKPGDAEDRDCLDVALIEADGGRRYLLSASVPHSAGGCDALAELATQVLRTLA